MLRFVCLTAVIIIVTLAKPTEETSPADSDEVARGGYGGGGGGYGGGGHGGGGYGGGGYGGGGHHHGAVSMDSVSILGLLSLGALLLRSILTVLRNSGATGRSLDVSDINLPLIMSDIPEAIQDWHQRTQSEMVEMTQPTDHVIRERSVNEDRFMNGYQKLLRLNPSCIPQFLCSYWTEAGRDMSLFKDPDFTDDILDLYMVATAGWLSGSPAETASIYDRIKAAAAETDNTSRVCQRASDHHCS